MADLLSLLIESSKFGETNAPRLSNLTVVIPSYNRQDFIIRQCAYWFGSSASIIIMDGSARPLDPITVAAITKFKNITYRHSTEDFWSRLNQAAKLIQTKYTVTCSDDECFLPSGLEDAVHFLEHENDMVACIGQSLFCHYLINKKTFAYSKGYDTYRYRIDQNDVRNRLNKAFENYNSATCYAVTRSDTWRQTWGNLQAWSCGAASEIQQAVGTYTLGKVGSVDAVYWIRSLENPPVKSLECDRDLAFMSWWSDKQFTTEVTLFVQCLAAKLTAAEHINSSEAENLVRNAISIYIKSQTDRLSLKLSRLYSKIIAADWSYLKRLLLLKIKSKLIKLTRQSNEELLRDTSLPNVLWDCSTLENMGHRAPFLVNQALIIELELVERLVAKFYTLREQLKGSGNFRN